nr:MAG TPA: hypothetical protein [Caudoviricetes sp.]
MYHSGSVLAVYCGYILDFVHPGVHTKQSEAQKRI